MPPATIKEPEYKVKNKQTERYEFTGTVEECTQYIADFGLGWSFLFIEDLPLQQKEQTVKMINPHL